MGCIRSHRLSSQRLLLVALVLFGGGLAASGTSTAAPADTSILIRFDPATSAAEESATLQQASVVADATIFQLGVLIAEMPSADAATTLMRLNADPHVDYAELDATASSMALPNDPQSLSWTLTLPHVPEAWSITTGSPSIKIAVIDSGVDATQPDLQGAIGEGANMIDGGSWTDTNGHGTEVAGTAAARANNGIGIAGTCPTCTVLPVKVLDGPAGQPAQGSYSDVAAGIVWATDHGSRIINLSLSSAYSSQTLEDAVAYARQRGVIVVAAAGNDASPAPAYPGSLPGVIGVAATDSSDNRYSFSNYGGWVALAAPGCVVSTKPAGAYGNVCGTSFASPFVAGIAGLALAYNPSLTAAQVADALRSGATALPGNWLSGGRVDALGTLRALGAGSSAAPTNVAPPTISGTAAVGSTVSASTGSWSGSPTSYAYEWSRCGAGGSGCQPIAGASGVTYPIAQADAGSVLQVTVTATNATGSASASGTVAVASLPLIQTAPSSPTSPASVGGSTGSSSETPAVSAPPAGTPTPIAPAPAPLQTTSPAPAVPAIAPRARALNVKLQGVARVGEALRVVWTLPTVSAVRWQAFRSGHWRTIGGATTNRLTLSAALAGVRVRASVRGMADGAATTAVSAASSRVLQATRHPSQH